MSRHISVIIPTFNEAGEIGKTLNSVRSLDDGIEMIVADGGSDDETAAISFAAGSKVINTKRGRGIQMQAGAELATGDILWFLHADSRPDKNTLHEMLATLEDSRVIGGNFTLRFDGKSRQAIFMTWLYPHFRKLGLLFGDSGIFVRREAFYGAGGFKPLPLFEDLDLVRHLRKLGKLVTLNSEIVTSSRRFAGKRFAPVFLRWILFQGLYWVGVSPHWMGKIYHPSPK